MVKFLLGFFLILHGIVHVLYAADSQGFFELKPGMGWPDGSWLLPKVIGNVATGVVATAMMVLIALGFVISGVTLLLAVPFWRTLAVGGAALSLIAYLVLWDGTMNNLDGQGAFGILLDLAIILSIAVLKWPRLGA